MTKKEMLEMLKDPDVVKELKKQGSAELEDLLQDISVGADDTLEDVSKRQNERLQKVVKYFTSKLTEVEASAVAKAQAPEKDREARQIEEFSKKNPGMSNPEVVELMQPLYNKGMSLEDAHKRACTAMNLDPLTGKEPVAGDEAKGKKQEEKKPAKSSNKSDVSDDGAGEGGEGEIEVDPNAPLDLDKVIGSAMNNYEAKTGKTPFA